MKKNVINDDSQLKIKIEEFENINRKKIIEMCYFRLLYI